MMVSRLALSAVAACLASTASVAAAADDVAVLTSVKGRVTYDDGQQARDARAFMKLRSGDRLELQDAASARIVYLGDGRQETYAGPAALVVKPGAGSVLRGAPPVVLQLPAAAPARIEKSAELLAIARVSRPGGTLLRGGPRPARPADDAQLAEARRTYAELRRTASPDDIGPELYLYSVLDEHGLHEEMQELKARMRLMQPWNSEIERNNPG
jgi:hypothetical protein